MRCIMLRRFLLKLHLIIGLLAAIELILLGDTGAVLVFEGELEHLQNPALWHVKPEGKKLDMAQYVARLEKHREGAIVVGLRLSDDPEIAAGASLQTVGGLLSVAVNPYTGEVL